MRLNPHKCQECAKVCANKQGLSAHMRGAHKLNVNGKRYYRPRRLVVKPKAERNGVSTDPILRNLVSAERSALNRAKAIRQAIDALTG